MVDINVQIRHWRESAQEDWAVACDLVDGRRIRHGLFFAHLALEKMLKAHVCRSTGDLAPRIHNLVRLVELTGLNVPEQTLDVLADMNQYNLEGRYPDSVTAPLTLAEAQHAMVEAREAMEWLTARF